MEKNEIALSVEEKKSLNSFSWNFILFLLMCAGSLVIFLSGIFSFWYWLFRKTYKTIEKKISFLRFMNYEVIVDISKEYKILKNKKSGNYGVCKNCYFVFSPRYKEIKLTPSYDLLFKPANNSLPFQVSFFKLERDRA